VLCGDACIIVETITELPGATPGPAQRPLTNTKTTAQIEAIEPRTIAIIAIFSGVEFYRP
jgi:hypothetical protein